MDSFPVCRAVLSALRKDLNWSISVTDVDVYLTILAVDLLLNAHATMSHLQAVLDTTCFVPVLSPYLDTNLGLDPRQKMLPGQDMTSCTGQQSRPGCLHNPNRLIIVIHNIQYQRKQGVAAAIYL